MAAAQRPPLNRVERARRSGGGVWWRRRMTLWVVLGCTVALVALVRVTIAGPRVHVRWSASLADAERAALERRHDLRGGTRVSGTSDTWRYDLGDASRNNIRALIREPAVEDTAYIDRSSFTPADGRTLQVSIAWYPYRDLFTSPTQLLLLHRSVWLFLGGGALLWAANTSRGMRRGVGAAVLVACAVIALAMPLSPSFVTMGGSADHWQSRAAFEEWFGGRVRFEKHLSQVVLWRSYLRMDKTEAAPEQAMIGLSRAATVWFVTSAGIVAIAERWSPQVLRYLALVLLAPSALLYFGWREFGYLSLSVAAFPLLSRGLRDGWPRLEAGSAFAGLGAALHGAGLVSLAGAWLAAVSAAGGWLERGGRALRVTAWGTAAYLGWMAIYVIVLGMSIHPDAAGAGINAWRPWFTDEVRLDRTSPAIFSLTGARDVLMSAWIVGAPLLFVAATLWRRHAADLRAALWYTIPSILFLVLRWPFDGIGAGMDLVVAGFPAVYALCWICAQDRRRAWIAALLLASAHYAFWRVVLDDRFQS